MKRTTFLKSLVGLALAPLAVTKIVDNCDKPHPNNSRFSFLELDEQGMYPATGISTKWDVLMKKYGDMPSYIDFVRKQYK